MPVPLPQRTLAIREMEPSDIPAVSALAARIWRAHYPAIISREQIEYMIPLTSSKEALQKNIREHKHRFWLAHDNGALAGYIALEPEDKNTWFIDKLYVDPDRHRIGIGEALLNHVTHTLKPAALSLRVNRANIKAINFYFKHGFVIEVIDVLDIGGGYVMDDFLMKKECRHDR